MSKTFLLILIILTLYSTQNKCVCQVVKNNLTYWKLNNEMDTVLLILREYTKKEVDLEAIFGVLIIKSGGAKELFYITYNIEKNYQALDGFGNIICDSTFFSLDLNKEELLIIMKNHKRLFMRITKREYKRYARIFKRMRNKNQ